MTHVHSSWVYCFSAHQKGVDFATPFFDVTEIGVILLSRLHLFSFNLCQLQEKMILQALIGINDLITTLIKLNFRPRMLFAQRLGRTLQQNHPRGYLPIMIAPHHE